MDFEVIDFEQYKEEREQAESEQTEKDDKPYRKERKKPRKTDKRLILKIAAAVLVIIVILLSPLFAIKNVVATEMIAYSKDEICEIGDIKTGDNLFLTLITCGRKLEKNPYFKGVDVGIGFPSTLTIEIDERIVRGYVSYMGSYLYIDENGLVMDSKTNFKEALPVFTGLEFDKFKVGEVLEVKDEDALETVVKMAHLLTLYDALDEVDSVNVSDKDNIVITAGGVTVKLGDMSELDQKIRTMREILKEIGEDERGTLDISDLSKPLIFKYLT